MSITLKNITLCLCILLLCACGAKDESASETMDTSAVHDESVLDAAELDPIQSTRTELIFAEPEETLRTVESILKSGETPALLATRGLLQSQLQAHSEAFDSLTRGVHLHSSAEMYALRAFVLWRAGHIRGAFRDAEYALYKTEKLPVALMVMGLVKSSEAQEAGEAQARSAAQAEACDLLIQACEGGLCFGLEEARKDGFCVQ